MTFSEMEGRAPYRYERSPFGEFGAFLMVGERLVCHVCGRDYLNLQTHAWAMHGLSADDYRTAFRLYSSTPLWASSVSKRITESNERRMKADPQRLKAMSDMAAEKDRRYRTSGMRLRRQMTEASRERIAVLMRRRWSEVPVGARLAKGQELAKARERAVARDPRKEDERRAKISAAHKGRVHTWGARGEANGRAKLTWEKVHSMRAESAAGESLPDLANRYGVSRSLVWLVVQEKVWKAG